MGKKVHIDAVREFVRRTPVFRARDIELLVGDSGYALLMLHNLVKGGVVHRVTKGWYSSLDDPILSVFAFNPGYLGLQEALSLRGLWEQETNPIVVTSSKIKPGTRVVFGENIVVRRVNPRYFFGFDHLSYGGFTVPVSNVEKTLIDLVYFGELPGREVLRELRAKSDTRVLEGYLRRYSEAFANRFRKSLTQLTQSC